MAHGSCAWQTAEEVEPSEAGKDVHDHVVFLSCSHHCAHVQLPIYNVDLAPQGFTSCLQKRGRVTVAM